MIRRQPKLREREKGKASFPRRLEQTENGGEKKKRGSPPKTQLNNSWCIPLLPCSTYPILQQSTQKHEYFASCCNNANAQSSQHKTARNIHVGFTGIPQQRGGERTQHTTQVNLFSFPSLRTHNNPSRKETQVVQRQ